MRLWALESEDVTYIWPFGSLRLGLGRTPGLLVGLRGYV